MNAMPKLMDYKSIDELMSIEIPDGFKLIEDWSDINVADLFAVGKLTKGAKFDKIAPDGLLPMIAKLATSCEHKDHTILLRIDVHDINEHPYTDVEYCGIVNEEPNIRCENLALLPSALDSLKDKGRVYLKVFIGMPMFWLEWASE